MCIGAWGLVDVGIMRLFHVKHKFSEKIAKYEPQANKKFFDPAIFQKCWRGVGEQPTFAEQIRLSNETQQKSRRKSKESQLPSNQKGCNEIQGFRGNCDSQASWGCAPALPNRIREIFLEVRFPITSRRQTKSFSVQQFFKNAAEAWASSPHLRSKLDFASKTATKI